MPRSGTSGIKSSSVLCVCVLIFSDYSTLFSTVVAPVYIPAKTVPGSLFSTFSQTLAFSCLFEDSYSDTCEVISHHAFGGSDSKNTLAMQETWVWSLGQEDTLEEEMTTHSSILTWRIPRTKEPGSLPWGCKVLDTTEQLSFSLSLIVLMSNIFSSAHWSSVCLL